MGKTYIATAHDDVENMLSNAIGRTINRWSKGKRRVDPVFKSDLQRRKFKAATIEERRRLQADIAANPHIGLGPDPRLSRLRAVNKLNKMSQPNTALRTFGRDNRMRPKIYASGGHGLPGVPATVDNAGNWKTVRQTSTTFKRMGLPRRAKIRAWACNSGTAHPITAERAILELANGNRTMIQHRGPLAASYGAHLAREMRTVGKVHPDVEVSGYLSQTSQNPMNTLRANFAPTHSMAVRFLPGPLFQALGANPLILKAGDAKVHF